MDIDHQEARAITAELQRWRDEARSLVDEAAEKSRLSPLCVRSRHCDSGVTADGALHHGRKAQSAQSALAVTQA